MNLSQILDAFLRIVGAEGGGRVGHTNKASVEVNDGTGVVANVGFDPSNQTIVGALAIGHFKGHAKAVGSVENYVQIDPPQMITPVQQLQAVVPIDQISPPSGGGNP